MVTVRTLPALLLGPAVAASTLTGAVHRTVQPGHVSVWLRET
jgi:hypothetical protein